MDFDSFLIEFLGSDRDNTLLKESNVSIDHAMLPDDNTKFISELENVKCTDDSQASRSSLDDYEEDLTEDGSDVPLSIEYPENVLINPVRLNFVPAELWVDQDYLLNDLIVQHFQKRSSGMVRFAHKLWNVLAITKYNPELYKYLGAQWISNSLIKVNKNALASTFGLKRPKASLFNPQGTFKTHGFIEISKEEILFREANIAEQIGDLDGIQVKVFEHSMNQFHQQMKTNLIVRCKWKKLPAKKKNKKKKNFKD